MKAGFIYLIIGATSFAVGAAGGIVGKRVLGAVNTVYVGSVEELKMDTKALMERYDDNPTQGFSGVEMVNIALEKYKRCEYSYSVSIGTADTVVQQTIRNFQIRNGNTYFEESISKSSFVSLADRITEEGAGGDVNFYHGKATSSETGVYPSEPRKMTAQEYSDFMGRTLDQMFIYIISDKTLSGSGATITIADNGDYMISVELNPKTATYYYKIQMINISGLDALPVFSSVKLTYTMTKDYDLKHLSVDESYEASMGLLAKIHNKLETNYYPNIKFDIPDLNTPLDYESERSLYE